MNTKRALKRLAVPVVAGGAAALVITGGAFASPHNGHGQHLSSKPGYIVAKGHARRSFASSTTIKRGKKLHIVNNTPAPHSVTLVIPKLVPKNNAQIKKCFTPGHICRKAAKWHKFDGQNIHRNPVRAGKHGWDEAGSLHREGDSVLFGGPFGRTRITARSPLPRERSCISSASSIRGCTGNHGHQLATALAPELKRPRLTPGPFLWSGCRKAFTPRRPSRASSWERISLGSSSPNRARCSSTCGSCGLEPPRRRPSSSSVDRARRRCRGPSVLSSPAARARGRSASRRPRPRRCSGGRPTRARGCSRRSPGQMNLPSSSLRNQLTKKIRGSSFACSLRRSRASAGSSRPCCSRRTAASPSGRSGACRPRRPRPRSSPRTSSRRGRRRAPSRTPRGRAARPSRGGRRTGTRRSARRSGSSHSGGDRRALRGRRR